MKPPHGRKNPGGAARLAGQYDVSKTLEDRALQ
jgi:hypothetical protein